MGEKMKKFWPLLATCVVCLVAAITLLIVLPLLSLQKTDADTGKQAEENRNQIDGDNSINDNLTGDDKDDNTNNGGTTPPTKPTEPVDPTPTEPTEPIDPDPTEPEPEVIFELNKENLCGTVWYDQESKLRLIFGEKNEYTLVRLIIADDGTVISEDILENDTWKLQNGIITLKPKSNEDKNDLTYCENILTDQSCGYKFKWQPNI